MQRMMKTTTFVLVFLTTCVTATVPAKAQQGKDVLPAPLPSQIHLAMKVFIANAGPEGPYLYGGGPNRLYNQFYAAMKSWGRYELVGSPAEADLVFEVSFINVFVGEQVSGGGGQTPVSSRSYNDPHLRLAMIDPSTRTTLWAFTEHIENAILQSNRDKNFDLAFAALVNDIRNVAGAPPVASASTKK